MELLNLKIKNYKVFKGSHSFDLSTEKGKPIILIGGDNGAGKTSIFEAIQLTLYGRYYFKQIRTKEQYQIEIKKRFCNNSKDNHMKLELIFKYVQLGETKTFRIVRYWEFRKNELNEKITLFKDDKLIKNSDENLWRTFINQIIPMELPEIFFFDNEKLKRIIDHLNSGKVLFETLNELLGVNLIDTLEKDIDYIREDFILQDGSEKIKLELEKIHDDLLAKEKETENLIFKKANVNTRKEILINESNQLDNFIILESETDIKELNQIKNDLETVKIEIEAKIDDLRKESASFFPFLLSSKLNAILEKKLIEEKQNKEKLKVKKILNELIGSLTNLHEDESVWTSIKLSDTDKISIKDKIIDKIVNNNSKYFENFNTEFLFDISAKNYDKLMYQLNYIKNEYPEIIKTKYSNILELTSKKYNLENQIIELSNALSQKNEVFEQKKKLEEEINILSDEINKIKDQEKVIKNEIEQLKNNYNDLLDQQMKMNKLEEINKYMSSVKKVLNVYSRNLLERKFNEFKTLIMDSFRLLSPNGHMLKDVQVNLDEKTIKFIASKDFELFYNQPSSGESQIFAFSIIMSLMKMLKWPMPLIIDTPLARLDSKHRTRLVQSFFPTISNQVIILSTDTEIDEEIFTDLQSNISRSFFLQKEKDINKTIVSKGYYFKELEVNN